MRSGSHGDRSGQDPRGSTGKTHSAVKKGQLSTAVDSTAGPECKRNVLQCREGYFRAEQKQQDWSGGAAEVEGREGNGAAQAGPCPGGHSCFLRQDGSDATSSRHHARLPHTGFCSLSRKL